MAHHGIAMSTFHNRTRAAPSIPKKLWSEGRWYLLPVYYLLITSHLAYEGIQHSGSYRFADHIYEGRPKGRLGIGKVLDRFFLGLPSARAFRYRYEKVHEDLAK